MAGISLALFLLAIIVAFFAGVALLLPIQCSLSGGAVISIVAAMAGGSLSFVILALCTVGEEG
jgi:hypothetical protein